MEMSKFILHGDILSLQARIDGTDYRFGVKWKAPQKPYDETWELKSYCNILTGEKNLTEEQIRTFMDTINAKWNWNISDFEK
ncbi:hypothetical protein [Clostridium sp. HMP27]|uniref:hypothetical protein n=1 Tax=Clostridium sp. HMP27 TaxID=1487921 RepID=UPI00052B7AA5|nr:hypothetical protein [Clostridium sp. HMP27]KGK90147.1 hypothetical protein DP68_01625 [Clostridium sp. HMP27]